MKETRFVKPIVFINPIAREVRARVYNKTLFSTGVWRLPYRISGGISFL